MDEKTYLKKLRRRLYSRKIEIRPIKVGSHIEEIEIPVKASGGEDRSWIDTEYREIDDYEEGEFEVPDIDKRMKALEKAISLSKRGYASARRLLIETYVDNDCKEIRTNAGRALGYSSFHIFVHEHPIFITIAGASVLGSSLGLSYILAEYLKR